MTLTFRKRRHAIRLPHYQVDTIKPLGQTPAIERYLKQCGVWEQAQYRLEELYYYVEDENGRRKDFFAAGWLNELGHWHVAAPKFTGCLSNPALTIIPGTTAEAWLFDTMFDYLRHVEIRTKATIIILNEQKLRDAAIAKARAYSNTRIFFNNPLPDTGDP